MYNQYSVQENTQSNKKIKRLVCFWHISESFVLIISFIGKQITTDHFWFPNYRNKYWFIRVYKTVPPTQLVGA